MALGVNAYIARGYAASGTTSTTDTVTTAASGSFLWAVCSYTNSTSVSSVTDNKGNTFTQHGSVITNGSYSFVSYTCANASGGSGHTATMTRAGNSYGTIFLLEITGAATASAIDTSITSSPQTAWNGTYYPRPLTTSTADTCLIYAARNVVNSAGQAITCAGSYTEDLQFSDGEAVDVAFGHRIVTATGTYDPQIDDGWDDIAFGMGIIHLAIKAAAGATLTSATPTGTIGTQTTATVGFTTNTAGGSAVGIIDIPARTAGITAAQIKAGHNNLDAAPIAVLSSITPASGANSFAGTTGLTANTGYSQAIVQTVSSVDSNVLIGSFTTAVATTSVTVGFNLDASTVLASTAMKFWTKNTIDGAAIDGGSGGLSGTTDASGNITLTGLTIAAGAKYLQYQVGSDTLNVHVIPVTYA